MTVIDANGMALPPVWAGDLINEARTEAYEAGYKAGERDAYERMAEAAKAEPEELGVVG